MSVPLRYLSVFKLLMALVCCSNLSTLVRLSKKLAGFVEILAWLARNWFRHLLLPYIGARALESELLAESPLSRPQL